MISEKLYEIYDGEESCLFKDYPIIRAKTAKEAIIKYLLQTGRKYNLKRSADNDVLFNAIAFREENGVKYKIGNNVWYKKIL